MTPVHLALLDPARTPTLAGSPTQALLDLSREARAGTPLVVMSADPHADRALDDPRAAFAGALGDEARTRLIGPASGGLVSGPGRVALVTAIGPLLPPLVRALGDRLGLAVDLGLAWDVDAAEVLAALGEGRFDLVGLALPEAAFTAGLARALRVLQGRTGVLALAAGEAAQALGRYDVACAPDLAGLVRALASDERPRGPRVAVVTGTGPLAELVPSALLAAGLELAAPSPATAAHLASELPLRSTLAPMIRIPGATPRHVELARAALANDATIDHVLTLDLPGHVARDPFAEAAHLARLHGVSAALCQGPSPLLPAVAEDPRLEAIVAASLLMRRTHLDRATTASLLTALDDALATRPALPVASLPAAQQAARHLGYPVLLLPATTPVADEPTLIETWEALLEQARSETAPLERRDADPFAARFVVHAADAPLTLTFTAAPLPSVLLGGRSIGLPLRERDLEHCPAPARPALRALSHLCQHTPAVASLELTLAADGALLHAHATLKPGDALG